MHRVFVDTDVLLDLFVRRQPHHRIALRFFSSLKGTNIQCFTSAVVMANAYYILARIRNKRYAIGKLRGLRRLIRTAPIEEKTVDAALEAPYRDFEDSLQYHCAIENGVKFLVTRNVADYPRDKLNIVLPGDYLKMTGIAE